MKFTRWRSSPKPSSRESRTEPNREDGFRATCGRSAEDTIGMSLAQELARTPYTTSTKMQWSRTLWNRRSITSGHRQIGITLASKDPSSVDTIPVWSKSCYNASVPATRRLSLHKLATAQVVGRVRRSALTKAGYTGHPLSRGWEFTPPTQWLADGKR